MLFSRIVLAGLALAIISAASAVAIFLPEAFRGGLTVGAAFFGPALPCWWSIASEIIAVRNDTSKLTEEQRELLERAADTLSRQVWGLFFLQIVGLCATVGIFFVKVEPIATAFAALWTICAIICVLTLCLIPSIRGRIANWKSKIQEIGNAKEEADALVVRLTTAAHGSADKPSRFKPYEKIPPDNAP